MSNGQNMAAVILLHLNIPVMDRWNVRKNLHKYRGKKIDIRILATAIDPADIEKAKQYKAVSNYMVKSLRQQNCMPYQMILAFGLSLNPLIKSFNLFYSFSVKHKIAMLQ